LKCFVRPDDSVCHAYRFDLELGAPVGPENACGNSVDSHWARGSGWAIYGFALAYKYTRDGRYLDAAKRIALKFLSLLDDEVVPVWDFRLPPGSPMVRDASALAVAVCGLKELANADGPDSRWNQGTQPMLARLCSDDYLDANEDCPGILKSGFGVRVAYSSWGDYFLMEALSTELFQTEIFW
jgi:unsaturated chondroitin disaccharide hydrolase